MKREKIAQTKPRPSVVESMPSDPNLESYSEANAPPPMSSFFDLFVRLTWMAVGPLGLMVTTLLNVSQRGGWLSGTDVAFFGFLGSMLIARWWEFKGGVPLTADGLPAKPGDLSRYELTTVAIAVPIWILTNVIGNYELKFWQ